VGGDEAETLDALKSGDTLLLLLLYTTDERYPLGTDGILEYDGVHNDVDGGCVVCVMDIPVVGGKEVWGTTEAVIW
jgi:hypothetical protein